MYYIIERYTNDPSRAPGLAGPSYDVREYGTEEELKKGILAGSRHGGKLIPVKGLEMIIDFEDNKKEHTDISSMAIQMDTNYSRPYE